MLALPPANECNYCHGNGKQGGASNLTSGEQHADEKAKGSTDAEGSFNGKQQTFDAHSPRMLAERLASAMGRKRTVCDRPIADVRTVSSHFALAAAIIVLSAVITASGSYGFPMNRAPSGRSPSRAPC